MYVLINYMQEREYHNLESGNTFVHLKSLCLFQELFFYDFCRNIIVKVELSDQHHFPRCILSHVLSVKNLYITYDFPI